MDPDGSGQTRVTEDELVDMSPSFAPDGQTIAFVQSSEDANDIFIVGADGSEETNLTETGARDRSFLVARRQPNRVCLRPGPPLSVAMNADGSDPRILFGGSAAGRPAWSPDGLSLAFESDGAIMAMSADGSDPSPLVAAKPTTRPSRRLTATGSPSTARRRRMGPGIFIVRRWVVELRVITRLTTGDDHAPTWSPDGSQIAFSRGAEDSAEQDIFVVNADGSGLIQLTTDPAADSHPSWSH